MRTDSDWSQIGVSAFYHKDRDRSEMGELRGVIKTFMENNNIENIDKKGISVTALFNNTANSNKVAIGASIQKEVIIYISGDTLSMYQAMVLCRNGRPVAVKSLYDSRIPFDYAFFYDCLDDLFSRSGTCTK